MNTISVSSKNVIYASKILFAIKTCYPDCDADITEDHNLFRISVRIDSNPIYFHITNDAFNQYALEKAIQDGVETFKEKDHNLPTFIAGYPNVYLY